VFFILRGSLKPLYQLSDKDFGDKVHLFKSVLDMHLDQRIRAAEDVDNEYFDEKQFMISRKEEVWQCLSPKLYTIFWYLNLQQLIVPEDTYTEQITKLKK
jgi:hypothetical protein